MMAAAARFVFEPAVRSTCAAAIRHRRPGAGGAASVALRNPRVLIFLALWFGLNLLFGIGGMGLVAEGQSVAWQAHIGGFVAGLLLFSAFDPIGRCRSVDRRCTDGALQLMRDCRYCMADPRNRPYRDRNSDPTRGCRASLITCPVEPSVVVHQERASVRTNQPPRERPMTVKTILAAKGSDVATIEPHASVAAAAQASGRTNGSARWWSPAPSIASSASCRSATSCTRWRHKASARWSSR